MSSPTGTASAEHSVVPLQPVDVADRHGLAAAVYAINALYIRAGAEPLHLLEVRARVAALVDHADPAKLALMLQEWYLDPIDLPATKRLLETLPAMIGADDKDRYHHNPIVNDIEWSALATIYRCCIAVKFLTDPKLRSSDATHTPGWKIAVPTPKIFGVKPPPPGPYAGSSCVFMVCHSSPKLSTYVALIPCDQEIFAPGRSLLRNNRPAHPSAPQTQSASNQVKVDDGVSPAVRFEGYLAAEGEDVKQSKRVTFADDANNVALEQALETSSPDPIPQPELGSLSKTSTAIGNNASSSYIGSQSKPTSPTEGSDNISTNPVLPGQPISEEAKQQDLVERETAANTEQLHAAETESTQDAALLECCQKINFSEMPTNDSGTEQSAKPKAITTGQEPYADEAEPRQGFAAPSSGQKVQVSNVPTAEIATEQADVQPETMTNVEQAPDDTGSKQDVAVSSCCQKANLSNVQATEETSGVVPESEDSGEVASNDEKSASDEVKSSASTEAAAKKSNAQAAQEVVTEEVRTNSEPVEAHEEVTESDTSATEMALGDDKETAVVMTDVGEGNTSVNKGVVDENGPAGADNPTLETVAETAEEVQYMEAIQVKTPAFVKRTRGGRTELEIGELSDATFLFQRVYYGAKRQPTGRHGKVREATESVHDVMTKMYGAVH